MAAQRLFSFDVAPDVAGVAVVAVRAVVAVLRRPSLWPEAVRTVRRMRPTRSPNGTAGRVPLFPPAEYVSFRLHTNAGSDDPATGADVVRFLKWTSSQRRVLR